MKKISSERKKELLKQVVWDYNISPGTLLDILEGKQKDAAHINRKYLINRCFNYLNWFQFVSLFEHDKLLDALMNLDIKPDRWKKPGENTIQGIEFAKRFLQRETLSSSG